MLQPVILSKRFAAVNIYGLEIHVLMFQTEILKAFFPEEERPKSRR